MPKGWFFEIHEDTPEQEAANLMEHSAAILDISSDDDLETKKRNEDLERGKENIPPPDFLMSQARAQASNVDAMETGLESETLVQEPIKRPRLRDLVQDAMDEDRRPLGDLQPSEFYGEGCTASSYVTVDAGIEKPSSLANEIDFSCPSPEKKKAVEEVVEPAAVAAQEEAPVATEQVIEPVVVVDEALLTPLPAEEDVTVSAVEAAPVVEAPVVQEEALIASPAS